MWSPHVPDVVSTVLKYPIPHALFMNNPKKRRTLLVLSMALFTDAFVHGIFVPILPIGLHDRTPVEDNNIQKWTATILAGQGIGNLLLGVLSSCLCSCCNVFPSSVALSFSPFLLGLSTLSFLSSHPAMLLVGRLLQGASTSLTWSSALPLIRKTLSGNQKESMSLMGIMTSIGAVLAPAIAGFIFSSFGWPAVAIAAAIVIIIDAISLWWGLRKAAQDKSSDEVHASETTPLLQPQEPDDNPYLSSINPWYEQHAAKPSATPDVTTTTHEHQNESTGAILGEVGRVAAGTLADPEARSSFRALVSNDRMKAALFGRFVAVLIVTGIDVVLPTYLFRTLLWESGPISLVLSLLGLPSFTAPIVDRLSQRFGATKLAPVGFVLTASIGLLRFILPGFTNAVPMLFGVIAATGIGLVMVNAPLTAEFNSVVEELGADLNSDETDVADQAQAILHVTIYSASLGSSAFCGWAAQTRGWDMLTLVWSVLSLASAIMVTTIFKARAAKRALKRTIIPRRRTSHSP